MTVELLNTYGILRIGVAEFLFDLDDLPIIKGRDSWYCDKDGYLVSSYFYCGVRRFVRFHRLVMHAKPGQFVDHINKTRPIIEKRICAVASGQRTTGTAASISPTHLAFPAFSLISKEKNGSPVLPITVRRFTSAGTMQKKMPLWHGSQKRLNFIGSSLLRKHFWKRLVFVPTELWHKAVGVKLQNGTHR